MSLTNFVAPPKFDEYKERFKDFYKMGAATTASSWCKPTPKAGRYN